MSNSFFYNAKIEKAEGSPCDCSPFVTFNLTLSEPSRGGHAARGLVILHQNHLEIRGKSGSTRLDVDPAIAVREVRQIRCDVAAVIDEELAKFGAELEQKHLAAMEKQKINAFAAGIAAEQKVGRSKLRALRLKFLKRRFKRLAGKK